MTCRVAAAIGVLLAAAIAACDGPGRTEAAQITGGDPKRGVEAIGHYGCAACHTIPGIRGATAQVGPPLTAIARRTYLAGEVINTPVNMTKWIQHPRQIERGTAMPDMGVTDQDARDIAAYLYTLR
jgi:cytochrome c2